MPFGLPQKIIMIKNKICIYGLRCPISKEMKYIGRTYNLDERIKAHLRPSSLKLTHNKPFAAWLFELNKNGSRPIV